MLSKFILFIRKFLKSFKRSHFNYVIKAGLLLLIIVSQEVRAESKKLIETWLPALAKKRDKELDLPGTFLDLSYSNGKDGRSYKLYLPSHYQEKPLPLIVMLHGCTQSAEDFAIGTKMNWLAERHHFLVAYPEQSVSANQTKCWNWFKEADQRREGGEAALIAEITRHIIKNYHVDTHRIYAAGLSAGGAKAAILGQAFPDLYAAIGVHSGLACGAAKDMPSAVLAMKEGASTPICPISPQKRLVPIIVFHGDQDLIVNQKNAEQVIKQGQAIMANKLIIEREQGKAPRGHSYQRVLFKDPEGLVLFEKWLIKGAGHAWIGGSPAGTYTDPKGPDASAEMVRFFFSHAREKL